MLQRDIEDSNNRAHRNNIRIVGVTEGTEGRDIYAFLHKLIPTVLKLTFDMPFEIERAHRVPKQAPLNNKWPRPIILKVLRFQQVSQIMEAA